MPYADVNFVAVLVAAVVNMVLGFLWFGPIFGKIWMKLSDTTAAKMESMKGKMQTSYLMAFLGAVVMAYVLAHFVDYTGAETAVEGATTAAWLWLGVVTPVMLGSVLWEGKSWNLYYINVGYYLVAMVLMGALLTVWA